MTSLEERKLFDHKENWRHDGSAPAQYGAYVRYVEILVSELFVVATMFFWCLCGSDVFDYIFFYKSSSIPY